MLCCGVLTLLAALIVGLTRWARALPKSLYRAGGGILLVMPVLALAGAATPEPGPAQALQHWCGRPLE